MSRLYDSYGGKGFTILAFPCNQFLGQEPGSNAEVKKFATGKYGAKYPLFSKIDVNGAGESEVYTYLKKSFGGPVPWNFGAKFIVDKDGIPVARFGAGDNWSEVEAKIKSLL